ncbi:hypothetical protein Taro_044125 [Colocasia esculenta]|uniref:Uncharacterized protein n=1 Tax=Colocasia esculenta TaxID=4460 RepID=A0A843X516_COLES|nr:hypothetical protein [Colocasia esculenta]
MCVLAQRPGKQAHGDAMEARKAELEAAGLGDLGAQSCALATEELGACEAGPTVEGARRVACWRFGPVANLSTGGSGQLRWWCPAEVALVCWVRCKREAGAGCAERRGVLCAMRSWACAMEAEDPGRL